MGWCSKLHLLVAVLYCLGVSGQRIPNLSGKEGEGYSIEVLIGTPPQKFNVLVDTGSTNFAISGEAHPFIEGYFDNQNSSTFVSKERDVTVMYTQGFWKGQWGSDVIVFPSLHTPEVRCDVAVIDGSLNFFMNGSQWQGILGLAYAAIARPNPSMRSWLGQLEEHKGKLTAFSLELCGTADDENTYTGYFTVLDEEEDDKNVTVFTSPIIREWFYELVITGISVGGHSVDLPCIEFNRVKTILDSGTTSLKLPTEVHRKVMLLIITTANDEGFSISDGFRQESELWCWKESMNWTHYPSINISLMHTNNSYFTVELPPQSYFRKVFEHTENSTTKYCYKLSIEASNTGTTLGNAFMEGLTVTFNRNSKQISFSKSDCGPSTQLFGLFFTDKDFRSCILYTGGTNAYTVGTFLMIALLALFGFALVYYTIHYTVEKCINEGKFRTPCQSALLIDRK